MKIPKEKQNSYWILEYIAVFMALAIWVSVICAIKLMPYNQNTITWLLICVFNIIFVVKWCWEIAR